ncbi:Putative SOS response-associated peptidase YedK [Flaviramulus basaltis]|uniref:Abasic site processing protein n=1 Tax=Flaviramulus basaltis TaxID=369401 RepID=A0A1K2IQ34_9FLAO|nr:SOS response-associated peptidase [Flaviramulus basaltis]SFZ94422.1 Putative SOS response-associated peptidase YedK [Flaviramulus basaltis]
MCFHTSNTKTAKENERRFDASFNIPEVFDPYYHFAGYEKRNFYIIKQNEFDNIEPAYWGLMPENLNINERTKYLSEYHTYNARAENIFKSRLYNQFAMNQRCIILSDGFYEPHKVDGSSIPQYCKYKDHGLFAFAGLYSELDDDVYTATIITTIANPFFEKIHNVKKQGTFRMPLVLADYDEVEWLNSDLRQGDIEELLFSFTPKEFEAYPVSQDINYGNRYTNRPDIINKVDYNELNTLF